MSDERGDDRRPDLTRRPPRKHHLRRSEFDFVNHIRQQTLKRRDVNKKHSSLIPHPSSLILGVGDDAAIIRSPRSSVDTVITSDLLVEDIDFRLSTTTPRLLGHKALAVSLSDIAAMGARPRWALLSIGIPARTWQSAFLDEFYEGFLALADAHGVALIGGDVSRTVSRSTSKSQGPLVIDSIVLGEVRRGRAVLRSGARPGDLVFVSGALGGAAAGLRLLEEGKRLSKASAENSSTRESFSKTTRAVASLSEARQQLILRQLRPSPRTRWGQLLGEERLATAMIDLSDGLSSDLAHLCRESGVGAKLDAARVPVDPSIVRALRLMPQESLELALSGGEDFELLFTVHPRNVGKLPRRISSVPVTCIGEITTSTGTIKLSEGGRTRILRPDGFRHF